MDLNKNQKWLLTVGVALLIGWIYSSYPVIYVVNQENVEKYPSLQPQQQETLQDLEWNLEFAQEILQESRHGGDKKLQVAAERQILEITNKINTKKMVSP